jgi:HEPN domain-containing protein
MSKEAAKKWLKQAKHDLEGAEKNKEIGFYDFAAFLSQQAVEKLFKAILVLEQGYSPKIHQNDELARMLNLSKDVIKDSITVSADYAMARYPDVDKSLPCDSYTQEDAVDRIKRAKKIFELLKDRYKGLENE